MIAHSISSLTAGVTSQVSPAAMPFKVPQTTNGAQQQPSPIPDSDSGCSTPELDVDVVSCTPAPTSSSASSSSSSRSPLTEKKYCCQRCLNHGEEWPRKGHKPLCKWSKCRCDACMMVEHRRQLNSQLSQRKSDPNLPKLQCGKKVRDPKCARCGAHGQSNALRGHKKSNCPYSTCACDKCDLVEMRRMLMAKQIKLRRDQQKERKAQQEQGVQIEYELARQQRGVANDGKSMFFAAFSQPTGMVNNTVLTNVPMPAAMNFIGFQRPNMLFTPTQVAALQNSAVNDAVKNALGLSLISPSSQTISEIQQSTSPVMTTPLGALTADARTTPNSLLGSLSLTPNASPVSMSSAQSSAAIGQENLMKHNSATMPMSLQQLMLQQGVLPWTVSAGMPLGNLAVGMPQLFMNLPQSAIVNLLAGNKTVD